MKINSSTLLTGIIGYPVRHTLSPDMHNEAFQHLGLNYCYVVMEVSPEKLEDAIKGLKALGFIGVNVTVPHKQAVIPYLDDLDKEAKFIGAVNTIKNENNKLIGYNTDGKGFINSLKEKRIELSKIKVFMIGAGGAARAVGYYLVPFISKLYIYNRTKSKGEALSKDLNKIKPIVTFTHNMKDCQNCEMIINATSLGLKDTDPLPIDIRLLKSNQLCYDLIYRETPFLKEAKQKGCNIIDGKGMLLYQAVEAFKIWTKIEPPINVMKKALMRRLGKK